MGMTKAEMEAHHAEYHACLSLARQAEAQKDFTKAVDWAVSSWDHINGMLQFERKYEGSTSTRIATILLVLHYAPLLLDFETINKLDTLIKDNKRISESSTDDLFEAISASRAVLKKAHVLWDQLERQSSARQDELRQNLGGDQDEWRWMAETWERMSIVHRSPEGNSYRLTFVTDLSATVHGKCPRCGAVAKASKERFLSEQTCPRCRNDVLFVLLSDHTSSIS